MMRDPVPGGRGDQSAPPKEVVLLSARRELIQRKKGEYEERVEKYEKELEFLSPEAIHDFQPYYNVLAKMATAELLLEGKPVIRTQVETAVRNAIREYWGQMYQGNSLESVMRKHEDMICREAKRGYEVVMSYNAEEAGGREKKKAE